MKLRQKVSLVFLILGFLLSSIIRVKFNISDGFEFHNLWVTWLPPIFDFALMSSAEQALTSTFLGYAFFAVSGFLMLNQQHPLEMKNRRLAIFLGITIIALLFELISLGQDLFTSYYGQHFRIGLILLILGVTTFTHTFHSSKATGPLNNYSA